MPMGESSPPPFPSRMATKNTGHLKREVMNGQLENEPFVGQNVGLLWTEAHQVVDANKPLGHTQATDRYGSF